MAAANSAHGSGVRVPVEHVEELTCLEGHQVEVHWTDGQKAGHWQCPTCLETFHHEEVAAAAETVGASAAPEAMHAAVQDAGRRAHERSLVAFDKRKRKAS